MINVVVAGRLGPLQDEVVTAFRRAGFTTNAASDEELDLMDWRACQRFLEGVRAHFVIDCSGADDGDVGESLEALDAMLVGSENLALAAARSHAHTVYVSSAKVFGDRPPGVRTESDRTQPTTTLGATTVRSEQMIARVNPEHTILRSGQLYGSGWSPPLDRIIARARSTDELRIEPRELCPPTYARHVAGVLLALIRSPLYGVFHRSAGGECNQLELARALVQLLAIPCHVQGPAPGGTRISARPPVCLGSRRGGLPVLPHWRLGLRAWASRAERAGGRRTSAPGGPNEPPGH